MSEITKQELEQAVADGSKKAVTDVLQKLGIDAENFRESQADFAHLRKQRLAAEQIGKFTMRALITIFCTGIASVILLGIKDFLKN